MGRPIKKKYLGKGTGSIQVSSWRRSTGEESTDPAYIVRQRSTNRFTVSAYDDSWSEDLFLVVKNANELAPGEFRVDAIVDENVTQVKKFFNRTIINDDIKKIQWNEETSSDYATDQITPASSDIAIIDFFDKDENPENGGLTSADDVILFGGVEVLYGNQSIIFGGN